MKLKAITLLIPLLVMLITLSCNDSQRPSDFPPTLSTDPNDKQPSGDDNGGTTEVVTSGLTKDYLNTNRGIWQKPELILQLLGNLEDKVVADIGAGTGFFAFRLAPKAKKVIAVDINPVYTRTLDSLKVFRLADDIQERLETRLGKESTPNLKDEEVDIAIIVNTFVYIRDKVGYLRALKKGISKGGKLLIIEFKKKRLPEFVEPTQKYRLPLHEAEKMLYSAGYKNIEANDTALDYQYILVAEK